MQNQNLFLLILFELSVDVSNWFDHRTLIEIIHHSIQWIFVVLYEIWCRFSIQRRFCCKVNWNQFKIIDFARFLLWFATSDVIFYRYSTIFIHEEIKNVAFNVCSLLYRLDWHTRTVFFVHIQSILILKWMKNKIKIVNATDKYLFLFYMLYCKYNSKLKQLNSNYCY